MNTKLSLCVSGYHRYHLLYVDLYAVYIGYPVLCVGQRLGCILVLVIVSGVLTCYDVGKLLWSFQRGAWVLDGVGEGFMVGWGFSRASKILFGDMECSSFRWVFFKNSA